MGVGPRMGNLPAATPPKKNDSPSPSSYQLSIAPQQGVEPREPLPHGAGILTVFFFLCRSWAGNHSSSEFMSTTSMPCSEDSVSQYSFHPLAFTPRPHFRNALGAMVGLSGVLEEI